MFKYSFHLYLFKYLSLDKAKHTLYEGININIQVFIHTFIQAVFSGHLLDSRHFYPKWG